MQPSADVEADKVVSNIVDGFCVIGIVPLLNPLHLKIQEEALHHRVVPAASASGQRFLDESNLGNGQTNNLALVRRQTHQRIVYGISSFKLVDKVLWISIQADRMQPK